MHRKPTKSLKASRRLATHRRQPSSPPPRASPNTPYRPYNSQQPPSSPTSSSYPGSLIDADEESPSDEDDEEPEPEVKDVESGRVVQGMNVPRGRPMQMFGDRQEKEEKQVFKNLRTTENPQQTGPPKLFPIESSDSEDEEEGSSLPDPESPTAPIEPPKEQRMEYPTGSEQSLESQSSTQ